MFQLNGVRKQNFQLKLFNIAVTLKYAQGHWKCYEQVKLNEQHHHAKFDIYHIYGVWANPNIKVFNNPRHLTNEKHGIISLKYTPESHKSYCA